MLPSSPFRTVSICFLSLLLSHSVWGQKDAGSIAGTVKDASGATIPQAKVTITEVDKGTSLITSTGSSGEGRTVAMGREYGALRSRAASTLVRRGHASPPTVWHTG